MEDNDAADQSLREILSDYRDFDDVPDGEDLQRAVRAWIEEQQERARILHPFGLTTTFKTRDGATRTEMVSIPPPKSWAFPMRPRWNLSGRLVAGSEPEVRRYELVRYDLVEGTAEYEEHEEYS